METTKLLNRWRGDTTFKYMYTDGSGELEAGYKELRFPRGVATPQRPTNNGVAEQAERRAKVHCTPF